MSEWQWICTAKRLRDEVGKEDLSEGGIRTQVHPHSWDDLRARNPTRCQFPQRQKSTPSTDSQSTLKVK